ncbi:MAG: hypothetical protein DBX55_04320 [Verrucomicrobia bacterium]|nr:MAG: hypothetical protein DBX55_04320 [Verrucomicrobiota bacterium]
MFAQPFARLLAYLFARKFSAAFYAELSFCFADSARRVFAARFETIFLPRAPLRPPKPLDAIRIPAFFTAARRIRF